MSADSAGAMERDVHDVQAAAAARAAATAAALSAAAGAIVPGKKRTRSSGGGSSNASAAETKRAKDDNPSSDVDSCQELTQEDAPNDIPEEEGQPESWTRVPLPEERAQFQATRKAERAVRRFNRSSGPATGGFEVDFMPIDDSLRFGTDLLLKIFCDIRDVVTDAQPRLNAKGGVTVRVPRQAQIEQLRAIETIAGIAVKLNLPSESSIWGRVSGVHPMFQEKDLLELLREQGVVEVVREKYSTAESTSASVNTRVQKPSNRIRIRFASSIKPEVTIAHQIFKVSLCIAAPLQCLSCCGFGHRAAVCPQKAPPRCRKCGEINHQQWQCTAKARCLNCKGAHSSNDKRCPVYAVYARAARERFVGKVVVGLDNVSVKESVHFAPAEAPVQASEAAGVGEKPSFAAVVGRPAMMALVRTSEEGEQVVCYLPRSPVKKSAHKPATALPVKSSNAQINPTGRLDPDTLVASITARVIETVSAELDNIISKVVADAIASAIPKIAQAVAALISHPSTYPRLADTGDVRPDVSTGSAALLPPGSFAATPGAKP